MRYAPDLSRISEAVAESFGVRQVYGEPIERDGVLVIPAARVWSGAGAGGGGGTEPGAVVEPAVGDGADAKAKAKVKTKAGGEPETPAEGGGGGIGFGRRAEPAGAFVVDEHGARWVPALNVNRIVLGGQVAFVLAAAVLGWAVARRRRK
ncbi:hypothetical protein C8K30_10142 [Promicromonospora sp. AC04]|uniref:hypothetical protein n=1 Tax=Promicromonospora sp. AC04 TaxID=2135723 RepID=UPI000D3F6725|nr:hypothetical protein [Promicromonospora sp. AC04]PUB31528.1 hypothetical protein C8K30_10142 [Promicromonospora sp. AC04]